VPMQGWKYDGMATGLLYERKGTYLSPEVFSLEPSTEENII